MSSKATGSGPRVRIAPSPTGDPHVGTAYVALFNKAFAEAQGGTFVLRIDDTDRTRYRAESEESILRSIRWLGLEWDEGPDCGGPCAPYRQSERTELYRAAADQLLEKGAAYRCFCTPDRLAEVRAKRREENQPGGYDRHCRRLSSDEIQAQLDADTPHTVRLAVPAEGSTGFQDGLRGTISIENREIDDQVLLKSDGFPTYHLSNVVDDTAMGITHVIRAEEWIISTPKHVLIYEALGESLPEFYHVPLLRNADRSKISKRKNPVSLDYYREEGYLPEALLNFLGLLGWSPPDGEEVFDYEQFREHFRVQDLSTGGPVFDLEKLHWLNGVHVRRLEIPVLTQRLREGGFLPEGATEDDLTKLMPLLAERTHLLKDFEELSRFYFHPPEYDEAGLLVPKKKEPADGVTLMTRMSALLADAGDWSGSALEKLIEDAMEELGFNKPQTFMPLRIALTGSKNSPPVHEVMAVLGRDECVARLDRARGALEAAS